MTGYQLDVLGVQGVGKSAFTLQFVQGRFVCDYDPTIEDTYKRPLVIDNENVQLDILDTAIDDFAPMRTPWIRRTKGFIIVYAIDNRASFEEVEVFHREVLRRKSATYVPVVICGNKCDLEDKRVVSKTEGEELAERLNAKFFETSALTNFHIEDAFRTLVHEIRKSEPPSQASEKQDGKRHKRCVLL